MIQFVVEAEVPIGHASGPPRDPDGRFRPLKAAIVRAAIGSAMKVSVRHRIYDPAGEILHETFRPYAKFGAR